MKERCCAPQKPRKFFLLGALAFLLPKCPLCIPGFMAILGVMGLQIGFGAGLLFTLKWGAAVYIGYQLSKRVGFASSFKKR